ncbi:MAG: peptidylprolyl isomerase [Novosphingobium sp.]|nr:peptidylprolyl isomerase [Novosphingobium sp.]
MTPIRFAARLAPALLALTSPVAAQESHPSAALQAPAPAIDHARVAMVTDKGMIELDLDQTRAPVTTANFLHYVKEKRFDGTVFYRAMHLDWGTPPNGLIQGGTQNDPKRVLPPIAHEPTNETGIRHEAGTISMARFAPGTATGDFSIMVSDMPGLDANLSSDNPEFRAGFAAFGHVVSGMDVVRAIFDAPRSDTRGEGFMKGQMLEQPVRIVSVRVVARPDEASADSPKASVAP